MNLKLKDSFIDEKRWTKNTMSKDRYEDAVPWNSKNAFSWCLMGVINLFFKTGKKRQSIEKKINKIIKKNYPHTLDYWTKKHNIIKPHPIACFNDHPKTTFKDVKKILELANV